MPIHAEVLRVVRRLCKERGTWTFRPEEVVHALPDLNERSVRTHIVSRCCINAPQHHPHKWDYFRRVRRGVYELVPKYRKEPRPKTLGKDAPGGRVAETVPDYGSPNVLESRESIHVTITRGERAYVAECLEIAVVTQGSTLDETVHNLREAVSLHLEGEDRAALGLSPDPRLILNIELPLEHVTKA